MLGIKKFGFYVLVLLLIPVGFYAITGLTSEPGKVLFNDYDARLVGWVMAIAFLILLVSIFRIWFSTKCPQCKKVWVGKRLSKEDLGPCSGVFSAKGIDNNYHQYEKHKYLLSYKCTSCGHEWQKTVVKKQRLD